ncbi:HNH endonuclease [Streptomyces sp. NPDC003860]
MALGDVGSAQVLAAVDEFDRIGRDAFLTKYGFKPSRTYLLVVGGRRYDSKAVVGAAHGHLPGREPLAASEFSGGREHAVKLLVGLGFEVVPADGEALSSSRLVTQISSLRVGRTPAGPRLHQPITLLWALGRAARGEPRTLPWRETEARLSGLLAGHGRPGDRPRADYPVLALHHSGLWVLQGHVGTAPRAHGDAALRSWFEAQQPVGGLSQPVYELLRGSSSARSAVARAIIDRFFTGHGVGPLLTAVGLDASSLDDKEAPAPDATARPERDPVALAAQYQRLCVRVEEQAGSGGRRRDEVRRAPVRSGAARQAVLLRSRGRCENPDCAGQPEDVTEQGDPILEVDHVIELAQDGPDHPSHMVALCPNCHAVKTRGRTGPALKAALLLVARELHERVSRGA